jgi:hypothetical protein
MVYVVQKLVSFWQAQLSRSILPHPPEDGDRSSLQNVVVFCKTSTYQTMDRVQKKPNSSVESKMFKKQQILSKYWCPYTEIYGETLDKRVISILFCNECPCLSYYILLRVFRLKFHICIFIFSVRSASLFRIILFHFIISTFCYFVKVINNFFRNYIILCSLLFLLIDYDKYFLQKTCSEAPSISVTTLSWESRKLYTDLELVNIYLHVFSCETVRQIILNRTVTNFPQI